MSRINSSLGSGITIPLPQYRVKLINAESADHSNATKKGQSIDTDSIGYSNTAYAFFSFLEKRRKRWSILIIMKIFEKVYQGSKSLVLWMISRKNKSAERFKAESVTIISWSAVTKSCIAYEIWDLMSFEIWRLDQISDITEYSPKKNLNEPLHFRTTCHLTSKFVPANFLNWWRILFPKLQAPLYRQFEPSCRDFKVEVSFFIPKFTYITPCKLKHCPHSFVRFYRFEDS